MELWPWDIELERDTSVTLDIFGKLFRLERINPTTLRLSLIHI